MASKVRMVSVIYGHLPEKVSRKAVERFIQLHAFDQGLDVPQSPVADYWCRLAPAGAPAKYMIGWTAPVVPREYPPLVELAQ